MSSGLDAKPLTLQLLRHDIADAIQKRTTVLSRDRGEIHELQARLQRDPDEVNYLTDDEQRKVTDCVSLAALVLTLIETDSRIAAEMAGQN